MPMLPVTRSILQPSWFLLTALLSRVIRFCSRLLDNLGLNLTYAQLNKRVTVAAVDDTQVMKITVQSDSPEWARQVCEQIITVAPDVIKEAVEAGSVKVISNPSLATEPVSPNIMKNTMLAAAVGFVLVIGIIVLQVLLDNKDQHGGRCYQVSGYDCSGRDPAV